MNRCFVLVLSVLCIICLSGCKKKAEQKHDVIMEHTIRPDMELSPQDSSEVYYQANFFLECLKNKDLNGAMSVLYATDTKGKITSLPEDRARSQRALLAGFLGLDYRIDYLIFHKDNDNELKYTVILFPKTDENDHRPNQVSFLLCPIREAGKWYLTMANSHTETHKSELRN